MPSPPSRTTAFYALAVCVAGVLFAAQVSAQAASAPGIATGLPSGEIFVPPAPKKISPPTCNSSQVTTRAQVDPEPGCQALQMIGFGTEGWVLLDFMVDPSGKPYEITVLQSTGNKILEQTAVVAVGKSTFVPGSLNGKPIDAADEFKYAFFNPTLKVTAAQTKEFIDTYKTLTDSINSGDKAAADAAMLKLKIVNLSEDAYVGVAKYSYAIKWGTEAEQLTALQKAVANETAATLLPADLFKRVLLARIRLELKTEEYAEALLTWKTLQSVGIDNEATAVLKPAIDKLGHVRTDDTSYDVAGAIGDGSWHLHLFKRHFRLAIDQGTLSQVKLRCERRFAHFDADATMKYEVAAADGDCTIEVDGAAGAHFKLTQF